MILGRVLLERPLQASALRAVLPAVIAAADTLGLDEAEIERSTAMRAAFADASITAGWRAEDHQIFAHDADAFLGLGRGELGGGANRLPIAAQQLAAGRSLPDPRKAFIL